MVENRTILLEMDGEAETYGELANATNEIFVHGRTVQEPKELSEEKDRISKRCKLERASNVSSTEQGVMVASEDQLLPEPIIIPWTGKTAFVGVDFEVEGMPVNPANVSQSTIGVEPSSSSRSTEDHLLLPGSDVSKCVGLFIASDSNGILQTKNKEIVAMKVVNEEDSGTAEENMSTGEQLGACEIVEKVMDREPDRIQTHCYFCGSHHVSLRPYPKKKNSPDGWLRHRCLKFGCRKFTGDFYIQARSGDFVVYKQDIRDYPFRSVAKVDLSNTMNINLENDKPVKEVVTVGLEMQNEEVLACQSEGIEDMNAPASEDSRSNTTTVGNEEQSRFNTAKAYFLSDRDARVARSALDVEKLTELDSQEQGLFCNTAETLSDWKIKITSPNSDANFNRSSLKKSGRNHRTVRKQSSCLPRQQEHSITHNRITSDNTTKMADVVVEPVTLTTEVATSKLRSTKKSSMDVTKTKKKTFFQKNSRIVKLKYTKGKRNGASKQSTGVVRDDVLIANVAESQSKKRTRSWGTQTFTYEVTETFTPSNASVCVQTELDEAGVVDMLLEKWVKGDAIEINITDQRSLLRRIKVAQTILYLQNKKLQALKEERQTFKSVQEKTKYALCELKKQYASHLLRVREEISILTNEFRLYHLDLQRACEACSLKMKEDEKKFKLVASKYKEENEALKRNVAELESKLNLCNDIIYSKTRDLLTADRDVHLANEQAANAQKKLEDKLFMASNAKCTSCIVFEKYRDVLTTQIADKTNALSDVTKLMNELRVKLEKQERASQIMSKEIDRIKFERDAWISDSKRLENEVNYLRARLNEGNVEDGVPTTLSDGRPTWIKSKGQYVSHTQTSPPFFCFGLDVDKTPSIKGGNDMGEWRSSAKENVPRTSCCSRNNPDGKNEKDYLAHDQQTDVSEERPVKNSDTLEARYPWAVSLTKKSHFESKPPATNRRRTATANQLIKKTKFSKGNFGGKGFTDMKDGKEGKVDSIVEARNSSNYYRDSSVSKPKSNFLVTSTRDIKCSGNDGKSSDLKQKEIVKGNGEVIECIPTLPHIITPTDSKQLERISVLTCESYNSNQDSSDLRGREDEAEYPCSLAQHPSHMKIRPLEQRIRSTPSFLEMENVKDLSSRNKQERMKKQSLLKKHEMGDVPSQVLHLAHGASVGSSSPSSYSRYDFCSETRNTTSPKLPICRPPWHRKDRPCSPSSSRILPDRSYVGGTVPITVNDSCSMGSSTKLNRNISRRKASVEVSQNHEPRRLENSLELPFSSGHNTSSTGASESWQIRRQDHLEQSWRALKKDLPSESWGPKRVCLESDRSMDWSEIKTKTANLVLSLPRWSSPTVSRLDRHLSPSPSYRDESYPWRKGHEQIISSSSSSFVINRQEGNWSRRGEQWNIGTKHNNDRKEPVNIFGDRLWHREHCSLKKDLNGDIATCRW